MERASLRLYLALAGATLVFGLSFVAIKFALRGFEPLLGAFLRFSLAGGVLFLIGRFTRERDGGAPPLTRAELGRLALLGFVSLTLYLGLENTGLAHTSAGEAAVLAGAIPIFVIVLNTFTLREPNGPRQWAGVFISFAGIIGLVWFGAESEDSAGGTLLGNLLVLGASLAVAIYTLMARHLLVQRSALHVTTYQHLFGALFIVPAVVAEAALVGVHTPTWDAVGGIAFLALAASALGYLLFNYALRHADASRVSVFTNLTPVVGVAGAYLVLGERFTLGQALAAAVVVLGVWLANTGCGAASCPPSS
ncbi:MAG: DMT family transporter [Thermoleophilia bacterium]